MFIVVIASWWYGAGWRQRADMMRERLIQTLDYFSISLLIKTYFSPFRQISSGKVNGSLDVKFRAFVDNMISRLIGSMVRSVIIFIGVMTIIFHAIIATVVMIGWLFVPILPVLGIIMFIVGWVPSWSL